MGLTPIYGPRGYDIDRQLRQLSSEAVESSPTYRRWVTRTDPLMFSLVYLWDHLSNEDTRGRVGFNQLHVDIANSAKRWMRDDIGPAEIRDAWIAPRGAAKTTWLWAPILSLWALAHGHQKFIMAFTNAGSQGKKHLGTVTRELRTNSRLRNDFPELCTPEVSNSEMYVAHTRVPDVDDPKKTRLIQVAIVAKGMDASTLGVKIGRQRPTLLVLDDIEPDDANYDATSRRKRLSTITNTILPMSLNAVVVWAATVTTHGSLAHDLVKAATGQGTADWITDLNIRPRHYPAIITDPDGRERSLWPQRWKMSYLDSIRNTRYYQLNYANIPMSENGTFWEADHFRYNPQFPIDTGVLSIDPAITSRATSDFTGLAVVAANAARTEVCMVSARAIKVRPHGTAETMAKTLRQNRWITTVLLEGTAGQDTWVEILRPHLPAGVEMKVYNPYASKTVRYADVLDLYEARKVYHIRKLPAFEDQALACPNNVNDDVLDAGTAGIGFFLLGKNYLR